MHHNPPKTRSATLLPLLMALAAVGLASCELLGDTSLPDYENLTDISYVRHVQVLFDDRCSACHGAGGAQPDLSSFEGLAQGASSGGSVVPFSAARSRVIRMLTTRAGGPHPSEAGGESITAEEVEFLRRWIDEGARDDLGDPLYSDAKTLVLATLHESASIALIDAERMAVTRYLDLEQLGFSASSRPSSVSAAGDGSGWIVALAGEGAVLRFDTGHTLRGLAEIDRPGNLSFAHDGSWFVVGREPGDEAGRVETVDASDMRVTVARSAFGQLEAVAIRPQGDVAYAASRQADQLLVASAGASEVSVTGIGGPRHSLVRLLSDPGGSRLFGIGNSSGQVVRFDIAHPAQPVQLASLDLEPGLMDAALSGSRLSVLAADGSVWIHDINNSSGASVIASISDATSIAATETRLAVATTRVEGAQLFTDISAPGGIVFLDPQAGTILRTVELDGTPFSTTTLSLGVPTTSALR